MATLIWWLWTALGVGLAQSQAITAQNWLNHPSIVEIRRITTEVDDLIRKKALYVDKKVFDGCSAIDLEQHIYTTRQGIVRFYKIYGGSDDSVYTLAHSYDQAGRLRFLFMQAGAVNNTQLEARYYFDQRGQLLWEQLKSSGPGYPFPDGKQVVVRNPQKVFGRDPCRH